MSDPHSRPGDESLAGIRKLALDFGPHPLARALVLVLEDDLAVDAWVAKENARRS